LSERARRRLEIGLPVPELERHRDPEAADAAVLRDRQFGQQVRHLPFGEGEDLFGRG